MQDQWEKENLQRRQDGPERFWSKPGSSVTQYRIKIARLDRDWIATSSKQHKKCLGFAFQIKCGRRFDACEPYYFISNIIRRVLFL